MNYQDFLKLEFFHNTIQDYCVALALFVVWSLILQLIRFLVLGRLKALNQKSKIDKNIFEAINSIPTFFYGLIAFYCSLQALNLNPKFDLVVHNIFLTIVIIQCLIVIQKIMEHFLNFVFRDKDSTNSDQKMFSGIIVFAKISLWTVGILLLASNMGLKVSSLIASLGIGGIAVALAAQNIFADLFSSFSIYFDKPFKVGDSIEVGNDAGKVIKIGLKTTRIQSNQGEEIVIANRELTSARIHNFRKMQKRKIIFNLNLDYSTSIEQVKEASQILHKIFAEFTSLELERASFKEFGDNGLNYEVVYFNPGNDYRDCMQNREQLNFRIKEEFDKAQIKLAIKST